ncbi:MAG: hypothetical protein K2X82_07000 [Gemmataceae bacterium]|nr:hypothetical protein [Gemmataceae bacterium]
MARKKNGNGTGEAAPPAPEANGSGGRRVPPVHEIRLNGRVRAAIWENHGTDGELFYSVTVSRSYKDAGGEWRTASSFSGTDLLVLSEVTRLAYLWVSGQTVTVTRPLPTPPAPEDEVPI